MDGSSQQGKPNRPSGLERLLWVHASSGWCVCATPLLFLCPSAGSRLTTLSHQASLARCDSQLHVTGQASRGDTARLSNLSASTLPGRYLSSLFCINMRVAACSNRLLTHQAKPCMFYGQTVPINKHAMHGVTVRLCPNRQASHLATDRLHLATSRQQPCLE